MGRYIAPIRGDLDKSNNAYRVNKCAQIRSANYSGFTFGGVYSLGGIGRRLLAQSTLVGRRRLLHGPVC